MLIGQELCQQLFRNEYQYVIATHIDHLHTHNHIVVNNVNYYTGRSFETEYNQGKIPDRAWSKLREVSDEICRKHHLSVIENPEQGKGVSHYEWELNNQKLSWKQRLKDAIDEVIKVSEDFEDFLAKCPDFGIMVDYNPDHKIDLKFMLAEQKERNPRAKFTRAKTLGWFYESKQIASRIKNWKKYKDYTPSIKIIRTDTEKFLQSKGLTNWADRENMKLTSKAMNILTKYGVTADEAQDAAVAAFAKRTALVGKMNRLHEQIKHREEELSWLTHYIDVKPFHDRYVSLKGRKQKEYGDRFDAELYRYDSWKSQLQEVYPKKFPTVKQLEDHIQKLRNTLNEYRTEYKALDQKSRELSEAAREIEQFLNQEQTRQKQQQKKKNKSVLE